jgi:deoxyribonuclease IV
MTPIRFGPAFVPSRKSPGEAVELLVSGGYSACEIDFEGGFWMSWEYAKQLGHLAQDSQIALSVHAPIPAFLGHLERGGKKHRMAMGMLDHSAGIALACNAEIVVFHPGFLLNRQRAEALEAVTEQIQQLHERLEAKGRVVPLGLEVMGRVNELGTLSDVLSICDESPCRPVLDFAHLHATTDGAFTTVAPFLDALSDVDAMLEPDACFHVHFSDVTFANRNEKAHVPYGDGTLHAEPLAEALSQFRRCATVIGESPDEASNKTIRDVLVGQPNRKGNRSDGQTGRF